MAEKGHSWFLLATYEFCNSQSKMIKGYVVELTDNDKAISSSVVRVVGGSSAHW